jgi:hypothetical protein
MYQPRNALAQVPGAVRHDLVKAQQMARDLAAADDEPDLASWNEMNTPPAEQAWRVSFGRSASFYEQPTVTPSPYADAILGQAVRVSRPRPPRPNLAAPQKTPAIIVNWIEDEMNLTQLTEDELTRLHADVQAEMRRRYEASKPAAPVGSTGQAAGWSVQAGRLITNDDKA